MASYTGELICWVALAIAMASYIDEFLDWMALTIAMAIYIDEFLCCLALAIARAAIAMVYVVIGRPWLLPWRPAMVWFFHWLTLAIAMATCNDYFLIAWPWLLPWRPTPIDYFLSWPWLLSWRLFELTVRQLS